MQDNTGLDALFQNADDPAWQQLMAAQADEAPMQQSLDPAVYAAVFQTTAGKMVLEDMYNRYVNVSRAVPGQGAEAAFYREGMAQVVFEIVGNINQANQGDDNGN